jgi:hypothetical protein
MREPRDEMPPSAVRYGPIDPSSPMQLTHQLTQSVWAEIHECPFLALNVSAGTARFRQLSEAMRKTYARREFFSP